MATTARELYILRKRDIRLTREILVHCRLAKQKSFRFATFEEFISNQNNQCALHLHTNIIATLFKELSDECRARLNCPEFVHILESHEKSLQCEDDCDPRDIWKDGIYGVSAIYDKVVAERAYLSKLTGIALNDSAFIVC